MSMTIKITIPKNVVVEAVKADTAITGNIDKAADPAKNSAVSYNEQIGDDQYHLRKIDRLIRDSVSKFESEIAEFTDDASGGITDTIATDIVINIVVSERYNSRIVAPLSGLVQNYIINMSLYGWWNSIRPEFAKGFAAQALDSLSYVRRCFAKASPQQSASSYRDITGQVV